MSDLDDIRLSIAAFYLESKFATPDQLINMISAHFVRQVMQLPPSTLVNQCVLCSSQLTCYMSVVT